MATLLLACELGEGLGHLNRLAAVARHLHRHDLVFAVQGDLQRDALAARFGSAVRTVAAPMLDAAIASPESGGADLSLAETLHRIGFADPVAVARATAEWGRLVADLRPDVIVADYAPTLRVAVATQVPQVVLGNGFTVPPRVSPLPTYDGGTEPGARSRAAEGAVLACFDAVRAGHGLPPLAGLADALHGDATFVASYAFLDPYRLHRETEPLQPFNLPPVAAGPPVAERPGPAIFAYLDAHYQGVEVVLDALNHLGRPAAVFVRNAAPAAVVRRCAPHVGVYAAPADLADVLPRTRLLVHHGGVATTVAGLMAGVPQLVLPRHTEQLLNARGLATLGTSVGLGIAPSADVAGLAELMQRLLQGRAVAERAGAVARELQAGRILASERPAVAAVEALLAAAQEHRR